MFQRGTIIFIFPASVDFGTFSCALDFHGRFRGIIFFQRLLMSNRTNMDSDKSTMIAVLQLLKKYNLKVSQDILLLSFDAHLNLHSSALLREKCICFFF